MLQFHTLQENLVLGDIQNNNGHQKERILGDVEKNSPCFYVNMMSNVTSMDIIVDIKTWVVFFNIT